MSDAESTQAGVVLSSNVVPTSPPLAPLPPPLDAKALSPVVKGVAPLDQRTQGVVGPSGLSSKVAFIPFEQIYRLDIFAVKTLASLIPEAFGACLICFAFSIMFLCLVWSLNDDLVLASCSEIPVVDSVVLRGCCGASFKAIVAEVTEWGFSVQVRRVDSNAPWTQHLLIDYHVFGPDPGLSCIFLMRHDDDNDPNERSRLSDLHPHALVLSFVDLLVLLLFFISGFSSA